MNLFIEKDIELAYDKLCNYYYYEKLNLKTRQKVFAWNRNKIKSFTKELNDPKNDLEKYLKKIKLLPYPKSFQERDSFEENYFSNRSISKNDPIKNFLVFIDAPIELHILVKGQI